MGRGDGGPARIGFLEGGVVQVVGGRGRAEVCRDREERRWRLRRSSKGVRIGVEVGPPKDEPLGDESLEDEDFVVDTDEIELKRREHLLDRDPLVSPEVPATRADRVSVEVGGKEISFESGMVARQAGGSVITRCGDTMMLNTACSESSASPSADFLPLRVDYAEKFSSIGKTVNTYMKREGKPTEREVLVSRLIDRPIRPMFTDGFFNEVQVLASVLSYDGSAPCDALAICGCAAALHISPIPLLQPIAAVHLAYIDGKFVVNPSKDEENDGKTSIVIAGTATAILMIEGVCDFLTEEQLLEGLELAQSSIAKICGAMEELRSIVGKPKMDVNLRVVSEELLEKVRSFTEGLDEAVKVIGKKERERAVNTVKDRVFSALSPSSEELVMDPAAAENLVLLQMAWKKVISGRMRRLIVEDDRRPDGRGSTTVRPIHIVPGFLPMAHGSVLFTRGETQTLAVATLGGEDMAMRQETIDGEASLRFYLQYSFPPFSVGEVGRVGAPGRREVGHGKLAERSINNVMPSKEEFPYVSRVESSVLESNGSSSMASVCGGCLALMDAGVPIKRVVAGVAMGLILEEDAVAILTDILGMEDALGDMDFKVAGDEEGISALQMDIKVEGITTEIMQKALAQAKDGRLHVLSKMKEALPEPRKTLPATVPKVRTVTISAKKIGEVIGPGGKQIKSIIEECGGDELMSINIAQEGIVTLMSREMDMIAKATQLIESIALEVSVGQRFTGKVTKILPFGAYVEIAPGREAWCHISEMEHARTEKVEDVCKEGDMLEVEVTEVGRGGQFRVSRKPLLPPPPKPEPSNGTVNADGSQTSETKAKNDDKKMRPPRRKPREASNKPPEKPTPAS